MINYSLVIFFILITKQFILCGQYKEILHTDKLAGTERVKVLQLYRVGFGNTDLFLIVTVGEVLLGIKGINTAVNVLNI